MINIVDADSLIFAAYSSETKDEAITAINSKIDSIAYYTQSNSFIFFCSKKSFRHKKYKSYKAQRKPPTFPMYKTAKDYVYSLSVRMNDLEADDLVLYTKRNLFPEGTICSLDKDVLYSIEGRHFNYHYKHNSFITVEEYQIREFQAYQLLCGDRVDNIQGIKGIGDKTAKKLINQWEFEDKDYFDEIKALYIKEGREGDFKKNRELLHILSTMEEISIVVGDIKALNEQIQKNVRQWK